MIINTIIFIAMIIAFVLMYIKHLRQEEKRRELLLLLDAHMSRLELDIDFIVGTFPNQPRRDALAKCRAARDVLNKILK